MMEEGRWEDRNKVRRGRDLFDWFDSFNWFGLSKKNISADSVSRW